MSAHRIRLRTRFLAASMVVVACTGLAVGVYLHAVASMARETFRERTIAYAQAFAANAESWLVRGQPDVVETLARFLVGGSVRSVDVVGPDGVAVHEGDEIGALPGEDPGTTAALRREKGAAVYLDVVVPMTTGDGHVRMAVDVSSSETAIRQTVLLGIGGALLFDGAVIWALAWALRIRRRPTADAAPVAAEQRGEILVGDLVIVPSRCAASFAGRPLDLTPKQFALLGVLASEPGRVFSEAEILAAAWPDSAYADARDVKQYVYLLRRKLSAIRPDGRDVILTVPGFGYRVNDGR